MLNEMKAEVALRTFADKLDKAGLMVEKISINEFSIEDHEIVLENDIHVSVGCDEDGPYFIITKEETDGTFLSYPPMDSINEVFAEIKKVMES